MNNCPCCSAPMLRHIHLHQSKIYWYCPHCHQEMPNLEESIGLTALLSYSQKHLEIVSRHLSPNLTQAVIHSI